MFLEGEFTTEQIGHTGMFCGSADLICNVKFDGEKTVKQLIETIKTQKEWGNLYFFNEDGKEIKFAEYKDENVTIQQGKEDILDRKIKSIKEIGNWGRTSYYISLQD